MDACPKPEEVDLISIAVTGKRMKRRWPVALFIIVVVVGTAAFATYGTELQQRDKIERSKADLQAAVDEVRSAMPRPENPEKWYRDRLPENHGGEEFAALLPRCSKLSEEVYSFRDRDQLHPVLEICCAYQPSDIMSAHVELLPSEEGHVRSYLSQSEWLPNAIQSLPKFDSLALAPRQTSAGIEFCGLIPRLEFRDVLGWRIHLLFALGEREQAWNELHLLQEVTDRLLPASSLNDLRVWIYYSRWILPWIEPAIERDILPSEASVRLAGCNRDWQATFHHALDGRLMATSCDFDMAATEKWIEFYTHWINGTRYPRSPCVWMYLGFEPYDNAANGFRTMATRTRHNLQLLQALKERDSSQLGEAVPFHDLSSFLEIVFRFRRLEYAIAIRNAEPIDSDEFHLVEFPGRTQIEWDVSAETAAWLGETPAEANRLLSDKLGVLVLHPPIVPQVSLSAENE